MKFKQDDLVKYRGKVGLINQLMVGAYNKPQYRVYFPLENKVVEPIDEKELEYA